MNMNQDLLANLSPYFLLSPSPALASVALLPGELALGGRGLRSLRRRGYRKPRTPELFAGAIAVLVHRHERYLDSELELGREAVVDLAHSLDVLLGLEGGVARTGSKVAGVERSPVVLREHHLLVVVGGEQDVEVERRELGVRLRIVEHLVRR